MITTQKSTVGMRAYQRLLTYSKKYWWAFLLGIVGTMAGSGLEAAVTWFLKPVLDKGFIARDQQFIHWLPYIVIFAFLARGLAGFMSNYFMAFVGRRVVAQLRCEIFQHLLALPTQFYDNTTSGHLLSVLIYNVDQVAKASTDSLVTLVQETCFVAGLLVVMVLISWQLTLFALIAMPLIAVVARYSSLRMRRISKNLQEGMGEVTHIAEEVIQGHKVVRVFAGESYEMAKFSQQIQKNRARELKVVATYSIATGLTQQVAACAIAVMVYFATTAHSGVSAGGFASLLAAMLAMLKPLKNLTTVSSTIQRGIAGAESIFALLDQQPEQQDGATTLARSKGAVEFRQVSFAYQADKGRVLNNISFKVAPGQTIALVGRSGSGKSTLVSLLPRFYHHYTGEILLDGSDARMIALNDLRKQFTLVTQNVTLFNDTIANNIAYGRAKNVTTAQIIAAATAAHAMEFIAKLPQGLATIVGQDGVFLSGGQRQRIAIARALLKDAPILILDEATSALDNESERAIQAALEKLMANRTTFVIAHRLSTVEKADQILVLEAGEIVEHGDHHTLLQKNGHYAQLYKLQFAEGASV